MRNVMVADPCELDRERLARELRSNGWVVRECADGRALKTGSTRPLTFPYALARSRVPALRLRRRRGRLALAEPALHHFRLPR